MTWYVPSQLPPDFGEIQWSLDRDILLCSELSTTVPKNNFCFGKVQLCNYAAMKFYAICISLIVIHMCINNSNPSHTDL